MGFRDSSEGPFIRRFPSNSDEYVHNLCTASAERFVLLLKEPAQLRSVVYRLSRPSLL